MRKVFEDYELSRVGQFQSVLEAAGIRTMLKNQYVSGAFGEIPFAKAIPELWVLEEKDSAKALELINELLTNPAEDQPDWVCGECSTEVGAAFGQCWNCSAAKPVV